MIYEVVRDLLVDGRVVLVELAVDDDDSTFDEEYDARITIVLRHSPHDGTTAGAVAKRLHKLPEFKGLRFSSYETLAEDELI
ncbi:hypothetical protein CYG49_03175 [Candidatus Saccharibacteria bacterium]|nr:MAG: hypothetical protein CYG49_03175 [Candidatus Saccharibacteria bacterium]